MTRSTMLPTRSGSTSASLPAGPKGSESQLPAWLHAAARDLGVTPLTAHRMCFAPGVNVFDRAATFAKHMKQAGRHDLVDRRCSGMDLIRAGVIPDLVTTAEHCIALLQMAESDAYENPAAMDHMLRTDAPSWTTLEKRLVKEISDKLRVLASGRLLYRDLKSKGVA